MFNKQDHSLAVQNDIVSPDGDWNSGLFEEFEPEIKHPDYRHLNMDRVNDGMPVKRGS